MQYRSEKDYSLEEYHCTEIKPIGTNGKLGGLAIYIESNPEKQL